MPLVAQAGRNARVAVVGAEDVAGARPVPADVRSVAAEVVGHDRVVPGRYTFVACYDDAAGGGVLAVGYVARDIVTSDLDPPRAEEPDADAALPAVVRNRVALNLEIGWRPRRFCDEDHARAVVVVDPVCADEALLGAEADEDPREVV